MVNEKVDDYDWITNDMFVLKLLDILTRMSADDILQIPGVYVPVSEHLNNRILEELEEDQRLAYIRVEPDPWYWGRYWDWCFDCCWRD